MRETPAIQAFQRKRTHRVKVAPAARVQWSMNHEATQKFTITQVGYTHAARDTEGNIVAVATFAPPRNPAQGVTVMNERAAWYRRFSGA